MQPSQAPQRAQYAQSKHQSSVYTKESGRSKVVYCLRLLCLQCRSKPGTSKYSMSAPPDQQTNLTSRTKPGLCTAARSLQHRVQTGVQKQMKDNTCSRRADPVQMLRAQIRRAHRGLRASQPSNALTCALCNQSLAARSAQKVGICMLCQYLWQGHSAVALFTRTLILIPF